MALEVEVKASVASADGAIKALRSLGARPVGDAAQSDTYFAHPSRDLHAADEAFRLRVEPAGASLTWKGPRLDARSKTRVEVSLGVDDADAARRLVEGLGFRAVATVGKRRRTFEVAGWTVSVDDVDGLGPFVEVERVVAESEAGRHAGAVEEARALLARIGAGEPERRSYLELLTARGPGRP